MAITFTLGPIPKWIIIANDGKTAGGAKRRLVHEGISLSAVSMSTFCSKQVRDLRINDIRRISSAKAARLRTLFGAESRRMTTGRLLPIIFSIFST